MGSPLAGLLDERSGFRAEGAGAVGARAGRFLVALGPRSGGFVRRSPLVGMDPRCGPRALVARRRVCLEVVLSGRRARAGQAGGGGPGGPGLRALGGHCTPESCRPR